MSALGPDVVLSLGSNIGDSRGHLQRAVDALGDTVRAVSSVYSTPPWGGVEQDDFLNIVVLATGDGALPHGDADGPDSPDSPVDADDAASRARAWLRRCHELEQAADRVREVRWGPRTLDVDVVALGELVLDEPELTVPHPRAAERAFVLLPWAELDPTAELAGHGSIAALLAALGPDGTDGIERLGPL